jgi:hypothetical protein
MTNTHIVPYMVWNHSNLDLEWFYGPEPQQSKYDHALLRAQAIGRQTGNIPLVLARVENAKSKQQKAFAQRTQFGTMMVHEIRPQAHQPWELYNLVYEFGYGADNCRVFNYWDAEPPLQISDEDVKWLLLARGGKAMLIVCTWNPGKAAVTASLDSGRLGFTPTRLGNAEEPDAPSQTVRDGEFTIDLEGHGVRVLVIE